MKVMEKFKLKEGEGYIPLKDLIKLLGWVETGGEAMACIDNQQVKLNGVIETQRRKKVRSGDVVMVGHHQAQVE
jgi:ribosome-associated protein